MSQLLDRYQIDAFIDTFALGHYARVLAATDKLTRETVAFKVLRPEHLLADGDVRWEYRAFHNEASILHALKDSPHVAHLRDCGYISTISEAPDSGELVSFGLDIAQFNRTLYEYAAKGWRPYVTLAHQPRTNNLFYLMKSAQAGVRWRLPSEEGITLALQFANVLRLAHQQGIVYLDHKLEHVYWDGVTLKLIDFNSSKAGVQNDTQAFAKDLHNLCVGILYPIFTGQPAQQGTLRPQPGSLDVVEARYTDVRTLDFSMEPLLSPAIQSLLQKGAAMSYTSVAAFSQDLQAAAVLHGRDFPQLHAHPSTRQAREIARQGLQHLRESVAHLRAGRDALRDALAHDDLTPDLEDELRRLVKAANEMLMHRVIP